MAANGMVKREASTPKKVEEIEFIEINHAEMAAAAKEDRTTRGGKFVPITWLKIESDMEFLLRFMPPYTREGIWANKNYLRLVQHWKVGPEGEGRVICPAKLDESDPLYGPCYVCEQIRELFDERDAIMGDADIPEKITGDVIAGDGTVIPRAEVERAALLDKRARRIYPRKGYIYQVIDIDNPFYVSSDDEVKNGRAKSGEVKVQLFRVSGRTHDKLVDFFADASYGQITHPLRGYNFRIRRQGDSLDTEYFPKIETVDTDDGPQMRRGPIFSLDDGSPDLDRIREALDRMLVLNEHPFFKANTYDETKAIWEGREIKKKRDDDDSRPCSTPTAPPASSRPNGKAPSESNELARWEEANHGGKAMTVEEVAAWGGWPVNEIASVRCYGQDPDHLDQECWRCQIRQHCVAVYKAGHDGRSSKNQPAVHPKAAKPSGTFGKGRSSIPAAAFDEHGEVHVESEGDSEVEALARELEEASRR